VSDVAVRATDLERRFGSTLAVADVDLEVANAEIYGFLGPNGAGKSTLVRMLCTLLRPSGGRASVAGYDVATHPEAVRLRIGVALQEASLDDRQTGVELLRLQARLYGLTRTETDRRLDELGTLVDIGEALERRVGTYSGGMKRRLDLAAALIHNPDVLFLDEPTTGLDPHSRRQLAEIIRDCRRQGRTTLLTTHYMEEAERLCDRVAIVDHGWIIALGTPRELIARMGGEHVVEFSVQPADAAGLSADSWSGLPAVTGCRCENGVFHLSVTEPHVVLPALLDWLRVRNLRLTSLNTRQASLDDVFVNLTGRSLETAEVTSP
jgi:ABC-2 type transport system ATP-binding protein